jgi:hypothetical protein
MKAFLALLIAASTLLGGASWCHTIADTTSGYSGYGYYGHHRHHGENY